MSPRRHSSMRLKLFVAGDEPNSSRARANLERIISTHLNGDVELQVVNVLKDFRSAIDNQIFVTPALVINKPGRGVTIYGDLSDEDMVIASLRSTALTHG